MVEPFVCVRHEWVISAVVNVLVLIIYTRGTLVRCRDS